MKDSKKNVSIRIVIRHISGSKTNQIDEFPIDQFEKIALGRSVTSDISFDPVIDDVVSRSHGKIVVVDKDPIKIVIEDTGSKNGIFVNKKKIDTAVDLYPGDVIQLGTKGPEFQFDIYPPQSGYMKKTRLVDISSEEVAKPTRISKVEELVMENSETQEPGKSGVGKETVERIVTESQKKSNRNWMLWIIAGILVILGVIYIFRPKEEVVDGPITHTQIYKANKDKVVYIEFGWKLTYTQTGEDVYHYYVPVNALNQVVAKDDGGIVGYRAAYFQHSDGTIEPYIVAGKDITEHSKLISGFGSGTGFVVSPEGFILTARHVAGGWNTRYNFPADAFPGVLYKNNAENKLVRLLDVTVGQQDLTTWVPAEAKFFGQKPVSGKLLEGKNIYLDVTFDGNDTRIKADVTRISNKHDVTMIKIEMPESLSKVELADRHDEIKAGDEICVLGYPGISPEEFVIKGSQDYFNRNPQIIKVPTATISSGIIGRVIGRNVLQNTLQYYSVYGDVYQLAGSINAAGSSGGPLFDDHGRVIGIYFASRTDERGDKIYFAVPIKYGLELMGTKNILE